MSFTRWRDRRLAEACDMILELLCRHIGTGSDCAGSVGSIQQLDRGLQVSESLVQHRLDSIRKFGHSAAYGRSSVKFALIDNAHHLNWQEREAVQKSRSVRQPAPKWVENLPGIHRGRRMLCRCSGTDIRQIRRHS
jgi:hypothetical protein